MLVVAPGGFNEPQGGAGMGASKLVALLAVASAVSSCSQQTSAPTLTPTATAPPTATPTRNVSSFPGAPAPIASQCSWNLPGFGRRHGVYVPAQGTITMSNDGWCVVHINFVSGGQPYLAPTTVESPPSHGTIKIVSSGVHVHAYYRPTPGFVGSDNFVLAYQIPNHNDIIGMHVVISQ